MPLRKHAATIAKISSTPDLKRALRFYFRLPSDICLTSSMLDRCLGQADLVLALLRINHPDSRRHVEALIGHPIHVAPPACLQYRINGHQPTVSRQSAPHQRRITWVMPTNPRQPGTDAYARWKDLKVGRSFQELLTRGHTKRDLRRAVNQGWIR